jgi:hypothetical protein
MSSLPDFISPPSAQDPQLPTPYRFEDIAARMFPLYANKQKLRTICNTYFNNIAVAKNLPFRIKPIQSLVLMEVLSYPKMYAGGLPGQQFGYSTQNELLFSIPVVYWNHAAIPYPAAVGLFTPFLFVDNDWSLITGRDVAGLPKCEGRFQLPPNLSSVFPSAVDARVISPFSPNTASEFKPILEIQPRPIATAMMGSKAAPDLKQDLTELQPETVWPYGPLERLYGPEALEGLESVSDDIYQLLLASAGFKSVNYSLKQFRDAMNPGKAAYQSILECDAKLTNFRDLGTYDGAQYKLHSYDSLNIAQALGIPLNGDEIDPIFEIRFKLDVDFKAERNLYSSCSAQTATTQRSCTDIFSESLNLSRGLIRQQLSVTESMIGTMADGQYHPSHYSDDIGSAVANQATYCTKIGELTLEGLSHLFRN